MSFERATQGGRGMIVDRESGQDDIGSTNDNDGIADAEPKASRKVNDVVLRLARLIGRQMAREDFAARMAASAAANDNTLKPDNTGDGEQRSALKCLDNVWRI
jgi:hypothetical protein